MPRRKKIDQPESPEVVTTEVAATDEPIDAVPAEETQDEPIVAAPLVEGWAAPEVDRIVMFLLGGRRYALPIDIVQEIQQIVALTEFPDTSPALIGMVNLRGAVVPVIDLRILIGVPQQPFTLETPMIVCRSGEALVALIVDEVVDVIRLPEGCIQPASRLYELAEKLIGVCRMDSDLVFLLDLARLVPAEDLATFVHGWEESK